MTMPNEKAWNDFLAGHPMSDVDEDDFFDFLVTEGLEPDDIPVSELEVAWAEFERRGELYRQDGHSESCASSLLFFSCHHASLAVPISTCCTSCSIPRTSSQPARMAPIISDDTPEKGTSKRRGAWAAGGKSRVASHWHKAIG